MLGEVAKRVVNGAVLLIAAMTFFLVPVGRRTLAQHLLAIFGTSPAREAADACAEAGRRVAGRASEEWRTARLPPRPPAATPPDLPPAD